MESVRAIIQETNVNVRVYLVKKIGQKGRYEATIFPNELNVKIKQAYAQNFHNFCEGKEIVEYDSVHSEKGTIKKLAKEDVPHWGNILAAISEADTKRILLNKNNFTDSYSAIILVYEALVEEEIKRAYMIAEYRKIDSWYKKSVRFGFTANTIVSKDEEIFVLNGCIDTVITGDDVFVLRETPFEKLFNYYEKSKNLVACKKDEIEKWEFLDDPQAFYNAVTSKKGTTIKLARALEKTTINLSDYDAETVKNTLSQYDEFSALSYNEENKIIFTPATRDLIIDLLLLTYTRHLFVDTIVKTKGV